MKRERTTEDRRPDEAAGGQETRIRDPRKTLAVLAVERSMAVEWIEALCENIPGIEALWVDTGRGNIHLLYDGNAEAVEQVEHSLRIAGYLARVLGNSPNAQFNVNTAEGSV